MKSILVHELEHIRRYDYLVNLFQRVAEAVLFFHPAVWLVSRRIRIEREHCCDDAVVAAGCVPLSYAESLIVQAERSLAARAGRGTAAAAAALQADGGSCDLRSRVARILRIPGGGEVRLCRGWPLALGALIALSSVAIWATSKGMGPASVFTKAVVEIPIDAQGQPLTGKPVGITLTDAEEIRELAAFFPRMGTGRESSRAGGWKERITIAFLTSSGETVHVSVSRDLAFWSEGKGDWPVKGDFKAYVEKLRQRASAPSAKDFAAAVAAEFSDALRGQDLPWLDDAKLTALRETLERFVLQHQPLDMPDTLRLSLFPAIKGYVRDRFRTPGRDAFTREAAYCTFPDRVKTFQWELWLAMRRKSIDQAAATSLEVQREWLRAHIRSLPEALPGGTHQAALARLEAFFSDPFCPLFHQPMSDAQFEQVKKGLSDYPGKEEIRYVVSHVVWKTLKAQYPSARDLPLPFDDEVAGYGASGDRIELSFKSNASFTGQQLSLQAGAFLDVSGPDIREGSELPLLLPSLRGDVVLDVETQTLAAVRGATLIPLRGRDWLEMDAIPDQALMTPSEWKETPSIALGELKGIREIELSKFPGRFLAVRTAEGRLSVIEVLSVDGQSVDLHIRPRVAIPPTLPAGPSQAGIWGEAVEGVQVRVRADRKTWRADEIPALRWDVRNTGTRQFLAVGDGQRRAQLEVDGVWHQWPVFLRGGALPELGTGQSLKNQLITVSPIWSRSKPEELQWGWGAEGIFGVSEDGPPSLQVKPGAHRIRVAIVIEPSRAYSGDGFRVVSQPLDISIEALPAGQTATWLSDAKLAQAVKKTLFRIIIVLQESLRPTRPEMMGWIAQAMANAKRAATLAQNTPLQASAKQMTNALVALQEAVDKNPDGAAKEFSAAGTAYRNLVSVFAGETQPASTPDPSNFGPVIERFLRPGDQGPGRSVEP